MKYINEYRDKELVLKIAEKIKEISKKNISLMEVCGGHTMAIHKFGLPSLLPENIMLLSGPGCPVCVTSRKYIDQAIAYGRLDDVIITTYGDLIRVPGSISSLDNEKANGRDVRIVYSTLDALDIARQNKDKKVVFLGIGFETTAPASASAIIRAKNDNVNNFFIYSAHKIMPPAMAALIEEGVKINGYICPGHVSTITGSNIYDEIPVKYGLGCVISGFEPLDLMQSIYMLIKQLENNSPSVEIQYRRVVKKEGNLKAQELMSNVFSLRDDWWRGLGVIAKSGLGINDDHAKFDAESNFNVSVPELLEDKGCICGEILKGLKNPRDCKLFSTRCTPTDPVGACMVSSEGACQAYYRYSNV